MKNVFAKRVLLSAGEGSVSRTISWVALLGIAFGVATALVTLSVIGGFQKIYEQSILGFNAHLVLLHDGSDDARTVLPLLDQLKVSNDDIAYWKRHKDFWSIMDMLGIDTNERMRKLAGAGVTGITPFIFREGLGVFNDGLGTVILKAVDPRAIHDLYPLRYHYFGNSTLDLPPQKGFIPVLLGKKMLERLSPDFGQANTSFKMIIPNAAVQNPSLKQLSQTVTVVGTFESGLYEFDSQFVLTGIDDLQVLFNEKIPYSGFELILDDPSKAPMMARTLQDMLPYSFQAIAWDELNEALFKAMQLEKRLFFVMMGIILLIASFNIIGVLVILSIKVFPQLSLLRALGACKKDVGRILARVGLFIGLGGFVVGAFIALILLEGLKYFHFIKLDPKIYFVETLPVTYSPVLWAAVFALCMVIVLGVSTLVATILNKKGSLVEGMRFV
ncbi:FtsX-like permease family protein [bacterium]|nr:FtsX-like permease family protein [bacterium]